MPSLIQQSTRSFYCADLAGFTAWIEEHSFGQIARSRSPFEQSRWERSKRLVIVYRSGSIVVAGVQPAPAIALLQSLVHIQQSQELAWEGAAV